MKAIHNIFSNGQVKATLQLLFGKYNETSNKLSFQPLPSYWEMNPGSMQHNMPAKRN